MNDKIITKYVVLFNLETNEYLLDADATIKDWEKAFRFESEDNAIGYLEILHITTDCKLKHWCTRTFYEI